MRSRWLLALVAAFLALLIVPVLITQLGEPTRRDLAGVELEDTEHRVIDFHNMQQDLALAGLLFVPEGDGPFPAAVIIHGSGTSRRDNRWYLTLAQHLQEQGILVLLPDKRGSEGSAGDWRTASFQDLATDTLAALDYLRRQQQSPISGIGIIGMSQGGHIAPLVAHSDSDLDFVVNVVGGALPMHQSLIYEEKHNLRQIGFLPGVADVLAYPAAWSIIEFRQQEFWQAIGNFDPLPYWRDISTDTLILYGENDTNVPTSRSVQRLRSLENPHIEVQVFMESGHALEDPAGSGDSIFRLDALQAISDHILSTTD